jgi:hypothetical protein
MWDREYKTEQSPICLPLPVCPDGTLPPLVLPVVLYLCPLPSHPEDGSSMVLRNVGILPHD